MNVVVSFVCNLLCDDVLLCVRVRVFDWLLL